jgi:hypothetical protein
VTAVRWLTHQWQTEFGVPPTTGLARFIQHYMAFGLPVMLPSQWADRTALARAAMHIVSFFSIPQLRPFWPMISRALLTNYWKLCSPTRLVVERTSQKPLEQVGQSWNKIGVQRGSYPGQACLYRAFYWWLFIFRTPVMIFLSDGECSVPDTAIQDVCLSAVRLGCVAFFLLNFITDFFQRKSLSFHSISFGPDTSSSSLRRMANVALGVQNNASRNPQTPATATASVLSSFAIALDTVRNSPHLLQWGKFNVGLT